MTDALHLEELNFLLDSPVCLTCDHRAVLHWENGGTQGCYVCPCPGFTQMGEMGRWVRAVTGPPPRQQDGASPGEGLQRVAVESTQ